MPDFNKGDFTQQGVAGHVNANLRLNEKRLVNIDMTSNEEAEGCTITGTVKDLLNDKVYGIGSGVSGVGFVNPLIHFNITFENDVTKNIMWWKPGAVEPDPPTVFTFLIDSLNQLGSAPQVDVFFDSETPFEWDLTFIALYYHEGTSTWRLSVTASSDAQEIKSVTSSDCTVMFNAPTFACSIPDGQSEATINVVIGNK